MWLIWGRREMHTEFWWGNQKESNHLEELGVAETIILDWVLKKIMVGGHGLD
jgi:hypothetical protein